MDKQIESILINDEIYLQNIMQTYFFGMDGIKGKELNSELTLFIPLTAIRKVEICFKKDEI